MPYGIPAKHRTDYGPYPPPNLNQQAYVDLTEDLPETHIMNIKWHYSKENPRLHYHIATPNGAKPSEWVAYEEVDDKCEGGENALIAYSLLAEAEDGR
ncbi:hypothetical protein QFC24_007018 [Naganishia onofrii]|uniref:Uncharacterized protein n=1 Tax=Naganishia onofrii TaxID=1851511 RepID=A0ACC2WV90_9TREE|nr:hypothetical protein QFC24_007018 [Naganishia onofrii]